MTELRNMYLGIVESIESNKHLTVTWKRPRLSYPKFVKCKKSSKRMNTYPPSHQTVVVNTSVGDMVERRVKSVEIQTTECREGITDRIKSPKVLPLNGATGVYSDTHDTDTHDRDTANVVSVPEANVGNDRVPERLKKGTHVQLFESLEVNIPRDEEEMCGTSTFTEVTSIWESSSDANLKIDVEKDEVKNVDSGSILEVRQNLAMELLWVQQAINSRKNYLKLRSQMD